MQVCTFFGHRNAPEEIKGELKATVEDLIINHGITKFYVGNEGSFDRYARSVLSSLCEKYTHIKYYVVLAYVPTEKENGDFSDTIIPDGIESAHPRFAVAVRNKWLVEQADCVVTYITHEFGGAAKFAELAKQKKKTVINITKQQ